MAELFEAIVSWPVFMLVLLVFGFAPGVVLRTIVLCYPKVDPRRAELVAELYVLPYAKRPLWVAEQVETALFEGLAQRIEGVSRSSTRIRLARAGVWLVGAAVLGMLGVLGYQMGSGGISLLIGAVMVPGFFILWGLAVLHLTQVRRRHSDARIYDKR